MRRCQRRESRMSAVNPPPLSRTSMISPTLAVSRPRTDHARSPQALAGPCRDAGVSSVPLETAHLLRVRYLIPVPSVARRSAIVNAPRLGPLSLGLSRHHPAGRPWSFQQRLLPHRKRLPRAGRSSARPPRAASGLPATERDHTLHRYRPFHDRNTARGDTRVTRYPPCRAPCRCPGTRSAGPARVGCPPVASGNAKANRFPPDITFT